MTKNILLLATVTEVVAGGVKFRLDGELTARQKTYACMGGVPSVNDRVCVAPMSGTYVVLGVFGGTGGGGDVTGPSGATSGNIPVFSGTTGKVLGDGGIGLPALARATGWNPAEDTWTYASATSFMVDGDKRWKYGKGNPLMWTQNGTVRYSNIYSVSYNSGTNKTTVTKHGGYISTSGDCDILNTTTYPITANYYSVVSGPHGFPSTFKFAVTATPESGAFVNCAAICNFYCVGTECKPSYEIQIVDKGTATGRVNVPLPIANAVTYTLQGRENAVTGAQLQGLVIGNQARILTYSNGSPIGNGYYLFCSGGYPY